MRAVCRRRRRRAARRRRRRDIPQLHAAARRHHGQCRRAPRQTFGLRPLGRQRGDSVGRRHAHQRLPAAGAGTAGTAAAYFGGLQHDGAGCLRRAAVRHGFREQAEGFGRGVHVDDRIEDVGAGGRFGHDGCDSGRCRRGAEPSPLPVRHRTGHGLPVAGRPAGQLRRRGVGQDHRRRHSRREEELPDGHGHEPCRRGAARGAAPHLQGCGACPCGEDRPRARRLRRAGCAAPHGAADFAAFRPCAGDARRTERPRCAQGAAARVRPQPDGTQEIGDSIFRKNSRFGLGGRNRTSLSGLQSVVREGRTACDAERCRKRAAAREKHSR